MAHEVETMAYHGEVPWHGLGVSIPEEATYDPQRMIVAAGLDWDVSLVPLCTADKGEVVARKAVRRMSDGSILGTVGEKFVPLQNKPAFDWFKPFLESGEARFETAGALFSGARVFVLAKLNRDPLVIGKDDIVEKYLLLAHGHDGSLAIRVGFTPVRVVCNNTLSMAVSNGASQLIRVRHTSSAQVNLEAIRDTVNAINQSFEATGEQYRKLARKEINAKDVRNYVKLVFELEKPTKEEWIAAEETVRADNPEAYKDEYLSTRAANMLERIEAAIDAEWQLTPNGGVSLWHAYNGVTGYLNHERGRTQDSRLDQLWFGEGATLNKRALETALELAA